MICSPPPNILWTVICTHLNTPQHASSSSSTSFLILRGGGSSAVAGSPPALLERESSVLMRRLGWAAVGGGGGGGESGWGAVGRRLRFFFFFFGAVLVLLLDKDCEAAPPDDPYPSQSGIEIHPSSRYVTRGLPGMLAGVQKHLRNLLFMFNVIRRFTIQSLVLVSVSKGAFLPLPPVPATIAITSSPPPFPSRLFYTVPRNTRARAARSNSSSAPLDGSYCVRK